VIYYVNHPTGHSLLYLAKPPTPLLKGELVVASLRSRSKVALLMVAIPQPLSSERGEENSNMKK